MSKNAKVNRLKNLQIGVASESRTDAYILACLCRHILGDQGLKVRLRQENIFSNETKISPGSIVSIKKFFEGKSRRRPRLIIILTDRDSKKQTKDEIDKEIANMGLVQKVVTVVPEENIESWLVQCTVAINMVLNPAKKFQKIKTSELGKAKETLSELIGRSISSGYFLGNEMTAKIKIARHAHDAEIKSREYHQFKKDFLNAALAARSEPIFLTKRRIQKFKERKEKGVKVKNGKN